MNQTSLAFPHGEHKKLKPPRRAAMYMRMSTEHQKYSVENQTIAITEYATKYGIELVKEYVDDGKSGLTIGGRPALQRLLSDVEAGNPGYDMILVLDITRWGRFQDHDESAHHEFRCRHAGVDIEYVGEQFANDGSAASSIIKSVKRVMAKETSRELSAKVFRGQCTLIGHGFRQGGHAGYGLRRLMINERREPKSLLAYGERKSLQTDRVILVPGPEEEVETARWVYSAFTEERMQESEIATILNRRGIKTDLGREWTSATVHQLLTNEKYIGNNIYNRYSCKLKEKHVKNPPEEWVRRDGAFEAIIESRYFYAAQDIIRERSRKLTNDDLLEKLKTLYQRQGWLSGIVIDEAEDMPSSSVYSQRFGSLLRAYQLVGYTPDIDYSYIEINRRLRTLHESTVLTTIEKIKELGGDVAVDANTDLLTINQLLRASLVIARCQQTKAGSYRWKIHLDTGLLPDITVVVRMDADNQQPVDYYLLPALDIENPRLRLLENNSLALDAYRFDTLEPFFLLTEQIDIREVV
jgi:DNA invertase Pin-like site-specific DNA recombinase